MTDASQADDNILLLVAAFPRESVEQAIARLGLTAAGIAGREVAVVDTGLYCDDEPIAEVVGSA